MRWAAVSALLAMGCATTWYRSGATQMDFANDTQHCNLYARVMNENYTAWRALTHNAIYRRCMGERGWRTEPDSVAQTPPASASAGHAALQEADPPPAPEPAPVAEEVVSCKRDNDCGYGYICEAKVCVKE